MKFTSIVNAFCVMCAASFGVNANSQTTPYIEFYDDSAAQIIDKNATFSVLGEGYSWSEGPLWIEQGNYLLFSDVPTNTVHKYKPGKGVSVYLKPSGATGIQPHDSQQGANGLLLNQQGQLVLMQHGDRRVAIMDASLSSPASKFTSVSATFEGKRFNSPNDAVFHSNGDLLFTDPPYGLKDGRKDVNKALPYDGIFRVTQAGKTTLVDDSILYPNGIVFNTDESKLFVAASDRTAAKWYQFDVDKNGAVSNKSVFFDATDLIGKPDEKGLPDGMVTHSKGYLFATGPGGVFVFKESGELIAKIRTGKATANCTLSTDEKTLYMTAHDVLMSVKLK